MATSKNQRLGERKKETMEELPYKPMGVSEPSRDEEIEVLKLRVAELEKMKEPFSYLYRQLERIKRGGEPTEKVKRCLYCGKSLKNKRKGTRTCSSACRQAYYRHNQVVLNSNFVDGERSV